MITLAVSISLTIILTQNNNSTEEIRANSIEAEETLINYLKYKPAEYNESMSFILKQCPTINNESYLFNESKKTIELLNNNNSFILFINNNNSKQEVYNKQPTVCLKNIRLAKTEMNTTCGKTTITYGQWRGEAPLKC